MMIRMGRVTRIDPQRWKSRLNFENFTGSQSNAKRGGGQQQIKMGLIFHLLIILA